MFGLGNKTEQMLEHVESVLLEFVHHLLTYMEMSERLAKIIAQAITVYKKFCAGLIDQSKFFASISKDLKAFELKTLNDAL